jgi:hypothetical protein
MPLRRDLARQLAGLDHLDVLDQVADQAGRLQRQQVDFVAARRCRSDSVISPLYFSCADLKPRFGRRRCKRHLAAFEADLVEATGTGLLALVAAAGRLAQARTDAAADTALGVLAPDLPA